MIIDLKQKISRLIAFNVLHEDESIILVTLDDLQFMESFETLKRDGFTLVNLFCAEGFRKQNGLSLFYVLEKKGYSRYLMVLKSVSKRRSPQAIDSIFPVASLFEREVQDGYGITFRDITDGRRLFLHEGYPTTFHPLCRSFCNKDFTRRIISAEKREDYVFKNVSGEGVYHIPVGPVHAGIIEPGHFRFSAIGETVLNLEVRMSYKHRGIEKLAEGKTLQEGLKLAEAISGDETAANVMAYCMAAERMLGCVVPVRAQYIRLIYLEMERTYALLSDLAGMIIDVAYAKGASSFFILREEVLRWNHIFCGSRFFKNAFSIGGVSCDLKKDDLVEFLHFLNGFERRFKEAAQQIMNKSSVIDRFESTGIVEPRLIIPLSLSGPLARASGTAMDVRADHAYGLYKMNKRCRPSVATRTNGDVMSRFEVKSETILESISLIKTAVAAMPKGAVCAAGKYSKPSKEASAFTVTESCRGRNQHWIWLKNGKISRYKICTASFCNWLAIEHAVIGNIVPDFPLINKSMNLSYAGNDL